MSEWLRPLGEHRGNKGQLKQSAIKRAGEILDAAGVRLPDGAVPLASKEKPEVTIDIVKAIMGQDFIPEQVCATYGREVTEKELAQLLRPLTIEMLVRGKELGAVLSLRTARTGDGTPITGQWMWQTLEPRLRKEGKGRIFYDTDWYGKEDFFTQEALRHNLSLVFTTKDVLGGSTNVNYLEQTQLLADFLENKVFAGQTLTPAYKVAIDEFKNRKKELEKLLGRDWRQAATELSQLAINQLARRNFPEAVYDSAAYLQSTGIRLLPNRWDWTTSRSRTADGGLVAFGYSGADGAHVRSWDPGRSNPRLGVCASWVVSKI